MKERAWPKRPISYEPQADPLVKKLIDEMNQKNIKLDDLLDAAGVSAGSFRGWQKGKSVTLGLIRACLEVVGIKITIEVTYNDDVQRRGTE